MALSLADLNKIKELIAEYRDTWVQTIERMTMHHLKLSMAEVLNNLGSPTPAGSHLTTRVPYSMKLRLEYFSPREDLYLSPADNPPYTASEFIFSRVNVRIVAADNVRLVGTSGAPTRGDYDVFDVRAGGIHEHEINFEVLRDDAYPTLISWGIYGYVEPMGRGWGALGWNP